MTKGKAICDALKQLRIAIAETNHIEYHPAECTHVGDCSGSCPKCDEELEYLTREMRNKGLIDDWRDIKLLDNLHRLREDLTVYEKKLGGIPAPPRDLLNDEN